MSRQIRISKFLSEAGESSRRKAETLIREGRVRVNGIVVKEFNKLVVPGRDHVQVGNKSIKLQEKGVILLNKPRGVVSTMSDPEGRNTVAKYLTERYRSYFPVGRLDYDSSGLLILTNDGDLAQRLMHPRFGIERTYEVKVRGSVSEKGAERLKKGVRLEDGVAFAKRIVIRGTEEGTTLLEIVVTQGRNRIVRRMFDAIGHPVMKLKRTKHGPITLGKLPGGQIKKLTQKEYERLRELVLETKH